MKNRRKTDNTMRVPRWVSVLMVSVVMLFGISVIALYVLGAVSHH